MIKSTFFSHSTRVTTINLTVITTSYLIKHIDKCKCLTQQYIASPQLKILKLLVILRISEV